MIVYQLDSKNRQNITLFVQPVNEFTENTDWKEQTGGSKLFEVKFKNGKATVPDNLGQYLIDKKYAFKAPIFVR